MRVVVNGYGYRLPIELFPLAVLATAWVVAHSGGPGLTADLRRKIVTVLADVAAVTAALVACQTCVTHTPSHINPDPSRLNNDFLCDGLWFGLMVALGSWALAKRHGPAAARVARCCSLVAVAAAGVSYFVIHHTRLLLWLL